MKAYYHIVMLAVMSWLLGMLCGQGAGKHIVFALIGAGCFLFLVIGDTYETSKKDTSKFFIVECPCCTMDKYHVFRDFDSAKSHAENRTEYQQTIYGLDAETLKITLVGLVAEARA